METPTDRNNNRYIIQSYKVREEADSQTCFSRVTHRMVSAKHQPAMSLIWTGTKLEELC